MVRKTKQNKPTENKNKQTNKKQVPVVPVGPGIWALILWSKYIVGYGGGRERGGEREKGRGGRREGRRAGGRER